MNLRVLIPVALIMVGAGLYGLSGNLLSQKKEPIVEAVEDVLMVNIWKTKSELNKGQRVTRTDFIVEKVPESAANAQGISEDVEIEFVRGLVVTQDLTTGQWVTMNNLLKPEQDGYIELTISKNMVPYSIKVDPETIVGGVISHGSIVDVLALSSLTQNLANNDTVQEYQTFTISPILMAVKVIKVQKSDIKDKIEVSLVLELTRKDIARLVIAKKIAQLEVHISTGKEQAEQLHANSGDVLPTYRAIKEFRAGKAILN